MKPLFLILFSTIIIYVTAQSTIDTFNTAYYLPGNVTVTVRLLDKSSITGNVWRFTDSSLRIYGRTSAGDTVFKNINCTEMHFVKIKRYAFVEGMVQGGKIADKILGAPGVGYNSPDTKAQAQALAALASVAAVSGVVNSVAKKKKFKIKGRKKKFEEVFEILVRAQP